MGAHPGSLTIWVVVPALGGSIACGGGGSPPPTPFAPQAVASPAPSAAARPNIVFILADDLDWEPTASMPHLRALLREKGVTFANALVTFPLCGPSRATILTGQYTHNHGVTRNDLASERFRELGHEASNLATMLRAARYRTALFGKYQNDYPVGNDTYVPPGWDEWYAILSNRRADYFEYFLNENGRIVFYSDLPEDYQTDVLGRKAVDFIRRAEANDSQPFFMFLSVQAPHLPARPAHRHRRLFEGRMAPRTPSFNEEDVSDKPAYLRRVPRLLRDDIDMLDQRFRNRIGSMLAVDEMLQSLVQTLAEAGELDNTYIVFNSDNGYLMGQHRFPASKDAPYEDSIKVPLHVRGPGVPAGVLLEHLVANVDLLPTFLEIAGSSIPDSVDGRSLLPLLRAAAPPLEAWRRAVLIEGYRSGNPIEVPRYSGLRTPRYTYVEYETREAEFYDLRRDADQLQSDHGGVNPALLFELKGLLDEYRRCRGPSCRP